ncbi:hypothetical protein UlMin_019294 [Ulmus minor]
MLRFLFLGEERIDVRNMKEHKRSPCSVDQSNFTSLSFKCQKPDLSISSKDKKENLAARIVALQQLVSPYGKTDTASVLNEAMEYIQFLHEQVQYVEESWKTKLKHTQRRRGAARKREEKSRFRTAAAVWAAYWSSRRHSGWPVKSDGGGGELWPRQRRRKGGGGKASPLCMFVYTE